MTSLLERPDTAKTRPVRFAAPEPPLAHSVPRDPGARRRRKVKDYLAFAAFAGPNLLLIAVFTYRPLLENLRNSLLNWQLGSANAWWVGLDNYARWFTTPASWQVAKVTLIFTVATVGLVLVLGLGLATVLNLRLRGRVAARATIFAPYVLSGVGVGLVWLFIFDPTYGALSGALRLVGARGPDWYLHPGWALTMVVLVYVWKNLGYAAVVYLAGLQSVPKDLLDAAAIDGAGPVRKFFRITLPLLAPTTFFLTITTLLGSLQAFDLIHVMTKGGPINGTTTLVYQVYLEAFVNGRAGYSAAVATILFVVVLGATLLQLRFLERRVHYS